MDRPFRRLRRPLRQLAAASLEAIMPSACGACGEPGGELCEPCRRRLELRAGGCRRCGEPGVGGDCGGDHRELRHLRLLVAPYRFAGTGGVLVRRFKLDADPAAGRLLARAMRQAWAAHVPAGWGRARVASVPLHPQKRRRRGFDQAAWLAARLAARFGLRHAEGVLRRERPTLAQGDPRTTSRARNVAGAFAVARPDEVAGRRVLLVDDVLTSGATMRECAGRLRAAGARSVAALVACRS